MSEDVDDRVGRSEFRVPPILKSIAAEVGAENLTRQIERIEKAGEIDPWLPIGTAKELIETTCKTILEQRGKSIPTGLTLTQLVKETEKELPLVPGEVPSERKANKTLRTLVNNLTSVVQGLAELRNEFGTGHGHDALAPGLRPRHARLAVGAATAVATFLFETHYESERPAGDLGYRVSRLIASLQWPDAQDRLHAAEQLIEIGAEAKKAVSALVRALDDADADVREKVVDALRSVDPEGNATVQALVAALRGDEVAYVRARAAIGLGESGPSGKIAVPALIEALDDESEQVVNWTAYALAEMGPDAEQAVPALKGKLDSQNMNVQANIATALWEISRDAGLVVPILIKVLKHQIQEANRGGEEPCMSWMDATGGFMRIGPAAKEAVPTLIEALTSRGGSLRCNAATALGSIGPAAAAAVPALIEALDDPDCGLSTYADAALARIRISPPED